MKKIFLRIKNLNKKQKISAGVGFIVLILIIILILNSKKSSTVAIEQEGINAKPIEIYNLASDSPEASFVVASGKVESSSQADISVETTGVVKSVPVTTGQDVVRGELLLSLSNAEISAQLAQAEAVLEIQKSQLAELQRKTEGSEYIKTIENQQETNIDNAYSKLISEGLVAEPATDSYTQRPPVISGRYFGPEGTYKMIVQRGNQSGYYKLQVFNLEKTEAVDINETGPTPLGTRGLFVSFPDPIETYAVDETIWYIQIPNTKSSSYISNYNAYLSAKKGAGVAVQQSAVSENQLNSQKAQIKQAEANVKLLRAQFAKTEIRAPFSGSIVSLNVGVGEYVSPGRKVITLISEQNKQLKVFLSSEDAVNVGVGDRVMLDDKEIGSVSSIAKGIDSMTGKIEAIIQIEKEADSLIIGDFVNVKIKNSTFKNTDSSILLVPLGSVKAKSVGSVLYVVGEDNILKERLVQTGNIRGNSIEIISGLTGNEIIAKKASGLTDAMKIEIKND